MVSHLDLMMVGCWDVRTVVLAMMMVVRKEHCSDKMKAHVLDSMLGP